MKFIQGKNRKQSILFPESLDQIIDPDNEVRIIDLFAQSITISYFKFVVKTTIELLLKAQVLLSLYAERKSADEKADIESRYKSTIESYFYLLKGAN